MSEIGSTVDPKKRRSPGRIVTPTIIPGSGHRSARVSIRRDASWTGTRGLATPDTSVILELQGNYGVGWLGMGKSWHEGGDALHDDDVVCSVSGPLLIGGVSVTQVRGIVEVVDEIDTEIRIETY